MFKIYILNVPLLLQPQKQLFNYPAHNKDYGIEQDFLLWLGKQPNLLTNSPAEATWHYLPVYWTRWHINHNFAANGEGLPELQGAVNQVIINGEKTFTITQFDGGTLLNLPTVTEFIGARTINTGIDVPILCSPHRKPPLSVKKKYLATFNGSFDTHHVRKALQQKYADSNQIVLQGNLPTRFYKRWFWAKNYNIRTMEAYIALCPRGTSSNSFRFFEAMQLGTAPCLISDIDSRPFKKFIPWDEMSYYVPSIDELDNLLCNVDKADALAKGTKAYQYWQNELFYQKWCKYVIMELQYLNKQNV
ncbi:exostosin domain-containing protein [Mucilaginibacter phyllosphaerae]